AWVDTWNWQLLVRKRHIWTDQQCLKHVSRRLRLSKPSVVPQIAHGNGYSPQCTLQVEQSASLHPCRRNDKPRSNHHIFCLSVLRYLSAFPEARVMIQNGMCFITAERRITLPSGDSPVPHSTLGRNLKELIEAFHEQESRKSVTVQSTSPGETRAHITGRTESSALPFTNVRIPTAYNMPIASVETVRNMTGTASTTPILEALYLNSGHYKHGSPQRRFRTADLGNLSASTEPEPVHFPEHSNILEILFQFIEPPSESRNFRQSNAVGLKSTSATAHGLTKS
ncbi:hypothetical protein BDN70DRAFT_971928, partial [Pholiota conissans]